MRFCPHFLRVFFSLNSDKIVYTTRPHKFSDSEFRETRLGENHTLLAGVNESLPFPSACIVCPVRVKFAVTDLHIKLLCVREFRENRRREGRAFRVAVNEITSARAVCNRGVCGEQKCALVVGALRHAVQQTLQSC